MNLTQSLHMLSDAPMCLLLDMGLVEYLDFALSSRSDRVAIQ